jgi:GntR family transcriptional regulator of vanillate catabolism
MTAQPMEVGPLRRARLFDEVTDHLRDLILSRQIAPGTHLLQIDLAKRLGVSRTPLREAFRILERDGLIRIANGNKTVEVVSLDADDAIDLYQVREVLDGLAARLAAKRGLSAEANKRLVTAVSEMEASIIPMDLARYSSAHAEFHLGIVDAAGNTRLAGLAPMIRLSTQMVLTRRLQVAASSEWAVAVDAFLTQGNDDHRLIYEAIAAGDVRAAENLARRHVQKTMGELDRLPPVRLFDE